MSQYALTNPIAVLVNKAPEEFTRADLINVIETNQIERITFHYTGLDSKLKELRIPIANRYQAERILADGERVDGSSLFKGMVDAGLSDLYVVPVYRTAFLNPFNRGSLDFICRYLTPDGELAPFTLDSILYNAYQLFQERTGYEFYGLGELEFFLLTEPERQLYTAQKQRGYHAAGPFVKTAQIVDEMVHHITQITGAVKYAHSEVGYIESVRSDHPEIKGREAEQLEIEFLPTPIDHAADNLVLARWLIRNIAYKYNAVATFTPKLEEGVAGNGMHVHMELRKNGINVMTTAEGDLTEPARRMIGGLCAYADTLTAFGNTTSSAYLRLVPNQEAPTRVCWSQSNRSAMIRVPLGWSKVNNLAQLLNPQQIEQFEDVKGRQTVELRTPDGSAITHLLLAGITMAAEYGLTSPDALEVADKLYVEGNIFKNKQLLETLTPLPKSCVESAHILLEKRALYERDRIFPPSMIDYVARLLTAENDENINEYLIDLPADDRLHETRKIMHKDLHRH
ncbi:MAG: glutamine synthetase [Gemmatimonadetes bacterium]|nr:MAG: glutamine synthetase [Gemmatimonadota bacterium]